MNTELVKKMTETLYYLRQKYKKQSTDTRWSERIKNILPATLLLCGCNDYRKYYGFQIFDDALEYINDNKIDDNLPEADYYHIIACMLLEFGLLHRFNKNKIYLNTSWSSNNNHIFLGNVDVWYNRADPCRESDFTTIAKTTDTTAITRFGKYSFTELKNYYGKMVLRFSKSIYYNAENDSWTIYKQVSDNNYNIKMFSHYTEMIEGVFTKQSSKWFINNFKELFNDLFQDTDRSPEDTLISEICEYILNNVNNKAVFNWNDDEGISICNKLENLLDIYCDKVKNYLFLCEVDDIEYYCPDLTVLNEQTTKLEHYIKEKNNELSDAYRNVYQNYLGECEKYYLLKVSNNEAIHPEVEKALKMLEKLKNNNTIKDYSIDSQKNCLTITTNMLTMDYALREDISKAYLGIDYDLFDFEGKQRHIHYINQSLQDPNLIYVIFPMKIHFVFRDTDISVGFSSTEYYSRNYHSGYGSLLKYNDYTYGTTGCRGSFATVFADAGGSRQLTKLISIAMQYVKTFVPLDIAGARTLSRCMMADYRTGEILSSPMTEYIGYDYREIFQFENETVKPTNQLTKVKDKVSDTSHEEVTEEE